MVHWWKYLAFGRFSEMDNLTMTIENQYGKCVAFLQGDDATTIFNIMYPKGNTGGDRRTIRAAHDAMIEYIDEHAKPVVELLPTNTYTGYLSTKHFVLMWNYPYNWVALYQKVHKKDMAEMQEVKAR